MFNLVKVTGFSGAGETCVLKSGDSFNALLEERDALDTSTVDGPLSAARFYVVPREENVS